MQPDDSLEAQNTWKAQTEGKETLRAEVKPEELAALVRSRERLNKFVRWAVIAVMSSLAVGFLIMCGQSTSVGLDSDRRGHLAYWLMS